MITVGFHGVGRQKGRRQKAPTNWARMTATGNFAEDEKEKTCKEMEYSTRRNSFNRLTHNLKRFYRRSIEMCPTCQWNTFLILIKYDARIINEHL